MLRMWLVFPSSFSSFHYIGKVTHTRTLHFVKTFSMCRYDMIDRAIRDLGDPNRAARVSRGIKSRDFSIAIKKIRRISLIFL